MVAGARALVPFRDGRRATKEADRVGAANGKALIDPSAPEDTAYSGPEPHVAQEAERCAPINVERVDSRAVACHEAEWADLLDRAMDANVFLDPAFALPLIQHVDWSRRPDFLLAWEENGEASFGRLVGLMPVTSHRLLPQTRIARGFHHKQVSLGTPLLDRDRGVDAFDAMLNWLRGHDPTLVALVLTDIPKAGAFHVVAARRPDGTERGIRCLDEHARAILRRPDMRDSPTIASFSSAKKRKELGRQRRRLSEFGRRTYVSARGPADVMRAAERFLALEHNGWKGERGTALLADPALATFTRSMTRLMARDGKCRIDSIEIDGRPVAMGIVIRAGDRAHFWKTAFDETYAALSPGVQFALELTGIQLADRGVVMTDSCAMPGHPMIDRIWPDRMAVVDLMVDLRPDQPRRFELVYRLERLGRALRAKVKALHRRLHRGWT